ncbi:MAG: hypothetical protein RL329_2142 [Bacteroidota bacterium]|jgi:CRISPR/Cas system endoribonuclease Cas6 (RAMP superfamily)
MIVLRNLDDFLPMGQKLKFAKKFGVSNYSTHICTCIAIVTFFVIQSILSIKSILMSEMVQMSLPFNPAQLEIIQLFATGISEEELIRLRQILIDFKFNRVTALADKILDAKGWSTTTLAQEAKKIKRTPYRAKLKPKAQIYENRA